MISKKEAAQTILAAIAISTVLFVTSFLCSIPHESRTPLHQDLDETRTIVVKETEDVSFQREGDWVLATFVDGTICIHDKREAEPVCQKSVKGPQIP